LQRRELAITPMRETLELYQHIADGALPPSTVQRSSAPFDDRKVAMANLIDHRYPNAGEARQLVTEARAQLAAAEARLQHLQSLLAAHER
jgi:hypothetical protein